MDIFDQVTSLAIASRSRVLIWRTGEAISLCHDGYPRAAAVPSFRRSVGDTALKSTLPKKPVYEQNVGLL